MSASESTDHPLRRLVNGLPRLMTNLSIPVESALIDARFVRRQGLPPSTASRALSPVAIAWEKARSRLHAARQDRLFERYAQLHRQHYGPSGRGYQNVAGGSRRERRDRYEKQPSRLQDLLDSFPDFLGMSDGDSFLDLGCGTGQNIRMLAERFPGSSILGFDVNADAVNLIREFEVNPRVEVRVGDLTDDEFRSKALGGGFDHIILSHVFSLIFGSSAESTIALRGRILSDLVTACRSSLVILDRFGAPGDLNIAIEQKQRATVSDDVLGYFVGVPGGNAYMIASERTRAVVFRKDPLLRGIEV